MDFQPLPPIRILADVTGDLSISAWLRHVNELEKVGIDAYTVLDLNVQYRLSNKIELKLSARNLFDDDHVESTREIFSTDRFQVPTSYQLGVAVSF